MGKLMVLIAVTGFVLLSFNVTAFARDPSGTWGIEGRTDATLKISCTGDTCEANFQYASGNAKATGYVLNDKLALAYKAQSGIYFTTLELLSDAKMSDKSFDLAGKILGSANWVRK